MRHDGLLVSLALSNHANLHLHMTAHLRGNTLFFQAFFVDLFFEKQGFPEVFSVIPFVYCLLLELAWKV